MLSNIQGQLFPIEKSYDGAGRWACHVHRPQLREATCFLVPKGPCSTWSTWGLICSLCVGLAQMFVLLEMLVIKLINEMRSFQSRFGLEKWREVNQIVILAKRRWNNSQVMLMMKQQDWSPAAGAMVEPPGNLSFLWTWSIILSDLCTRSKF